MTKIWDLMKYIPFLYVFILSNSLTFTLAQEILGCGGFVTAGVPVPLDFSKVEVKLFTKQGSFKDQTNCAPNNGYYFIPLYDKGEYVLRVSSPSGWSFEPSEVALQVDGTTDDCSLGKDVNFIFQGFSIHGKVLSQNRAQGPSGVILELVQGETVLKTTESGAEGKFFFGKILPGHYQIRASHPKWKLLQSTLDIYIDSDSVYVEEGLVVQGYEVRGKVSSDGEPIRGVSFALESNHATPLRSCGLSTAPETDAKCSTVSDEKGEFSFPVVPPGKYKLTPSYKGEHTQFDIQPTSLDISVEDADALIETAFTVQGFRVNGQVLNPASEPLSGAQVFLDDKLVAQTDSNGFYYLERIRTGNYRLQAKSEQFGFEPFSVRIGPNSPVLPTVTANTIQVCGQIHLSDFAPSIPRVPRQLLFLPTGQVREGDEPHTISTDSAGKFCTHLKPGSYDVKPIILESEQKQGLRLTPVSRHVVIQSVPEYGLEFHQLKVSVEVSARCLESPCSSDILVSLNNGAGQALSQDSFTFQDLYPGTYSVTLMNEDGCWQEKTLKVEVTDTDTERVTFQQTGYALRVQSSHLTDLQYEVEGAADNGVLKVAVGRSTLCLPKPGVYRLTPSSCHTFSPSQIVWDSQNPQQEITLQSTAHELQFSVVANEEIEDLYVLANDQRLTPASVHADGTQKQYQFSYQVAAGTQVELTPQANKLLFFPTSVKIVMPDNCKKDSAKFVAQKGLYISGSVTPPIKGVTITVTGGGLEAPWIVETDDAGTYSIGPLNKEGIALPENPITLFNVAAEKNGFVVTPKAGEFGSFLVQKLAEIVVTVEGEDGQPLAGVLVSTAGGVGYRQNSVTDSTGKVLFSSLSPGDYFLRPILKEYKFQPASQMLQVEDGASVSVQVRGERVAFSAYGAVNLLNGEGEGGVVVEAVGTGEQCLGYQEEATSEANGQFRIRGLVPNCNYEVRLKKDNGVNTNIDKSLPSSIPVKVTTEDATNLRLVIIKSVKQLDVTSSVVTSQEYLKALKLKLYREDEPDSPVYTLKLEHTPFVFFPPLAMDGRAYFVQLDCSLPRNMYDYQIPEVSFTANTSYKHVTLRFEPKIRNVEVDTSQVSFKSLAFLLLCVGLFYKYDKVLPVLQKFIEMVQERRSTTSSSGHYSHGTSNPPPLTEADMALFETNTRKKAKPRKV